MAGYGSMPFGSGPFGLGTPATGTDPPDGPAGSRYLNPLTRDYQIDSATGQLAQMPGPRQRVLLALMTLHRSSTHIPDFGIKLPRKIGTSFEAEAQSAARFALRHMTETEQVIRIDSIKVERDGGRARITVTYTDLQTGIPDRVEI